MGEPRLHDYPNGVEKRLTMNVAMMQPAFMPWQGLFELISKADIFIFLDDFQFSVQSYHQRNRFFVNKGQVDWYTVPVLKSISFGLPLNEARINEQAPWRQKAWKRIQQNYSKAPFFADLSPYVQKWMLTPADSLAEQNIAFIKLVCDLMGFQKDFRLSSQYPTEAKSSMRVLELLRWCEASHYYCAKGSFGYMREEGVFPVDDIEITFQDFVPQDYRQVGSPTLFVPYLSVLDALLNVGPQATAELVRNGTKKWLTWDEMITLHNEHEKMGSNNGN